jgi:general secretion pathway protein D
MFYLKYFFAVLLFLLGTGHLLLLFAQEPILAPPYPVLPPRSVTPPENTTPENTKTSERTGTNHIDNINQNDIAVINIKEMTLLEFARLLSQGTLWKIVVSRQASAIPINTYFEQISGEDAIRAVCQANNLWYRKDSNGIISIMTVEEYRKGLLAHSHDTVKVITLLYPDARAVGDSIQRLFKNRVVWTPPDEYYNDPIEDMERALERMESLNDRVQSMQQSANRSTTSYSGYGRNGLMSSRRNRQQSRQNLDPLSANKIVEDIVPEIESEKLIAQLTGDEEMKIGEPGIIYLSAFRGTNDLMIRSSDPEAVEEIAKLITQLDKPQPQVLLEVKVLDLRLTDDESFGLDWLFKGGQVSGGRSTGILEDSYGSTFTEILNPGASLIPSGAGLDPKAIVLQTVSDNILARIQAMQDSGRVLSLATPNLCVADNEASRIFIGKETTVLTAVSVSKTTTTGDNPVVDTSYDPEAERMNIGTTLLITPRIHADRSTTIRIVQEDSQIGETQEIVFGTDNSSSSLSSRNMSFLSKDIDTRTVVTTVVAADGQVSAIGGLIREEVKHRDIGVPGLMKIPYLGTAFKTTFKNRERHELLILVRPFVLLAPGEGGQTTQQFLKRLSEHPSAHGIIPPLRIGEGSFNVINERIYDVPKEAFQSLKHQAAPWSTSSTGSTK